ncbi:MAG: hypothetical protein BGO70_14805 [Bacteroidetes bacterium 43-93]|nr:MAG: hypothetical protein BGO70_14805 [Bacteroidetes bacterium 43-93]
MRKCLLLVALIIVSQLNVLIAQPLFNSPDTVCPKQPVQLTTNVPNAKSHYWGFCSGYLFNTPVATALGKNGLDAPTAVEVEKDGNNYYAFVVNRGNNGARQSLIRLEFGNSLDNQPKITNYGTMDDVLPKDPSSLYIIKNETNGNWHVFVVGGTNVGASSLARLDFGKSLGNVPNIVNFGNWNNVLDGPSGLFFQQEDKLWYGFTFNKNTNDLLRIQFDSLLSLTPTYVNLGKLPYIKKPTDYTSILVNGVWHFFVTNEGSDSITRVDLGPKLATTTPTSATIGSLNKNVNNAGGISIIRDCDSFHLFFVNRGSSNFVKVDMTSITGPYTAVNFNTFSSTLFGPTGLTRPIRDHDNIYLFTTNDGDSNLVKVTFQQCSNASIQSSTTMMPPPYSYDTAGTYNIYYMVNEGMPDMQVQCKIITVLPTPDIFMSNDTTICSGDTISLRLISTAAINQTWSPDYNIDNTTQQYVKVWPRYSTNYHVLLPYKSGCIVDTLIKVKVFKVQSDAGPDRTIADGATTVLGGPFTSDGINYSYLWFPDRYMSNNNVPNPSVTPPNDYTYYLQVRDNNSGCAALDTVVVHVSCDDINLPNAFVPSGNSSVNRFGLANSQIVKLVAFRIFDRWGKVVFETTDPAQQWDGKVNGADAALGVYVWEAEGYCISGKRIKSSGNVTLIR